MDDKQFSLTFALIEETLVESGIIALLCLGRNTQGDLLRNVPFTFPLQLCSLVWCGSLDISISGAVFVSLVPMKQDWLQTVCKEKKDRSISHLSWSRSFLSSDSSSSWCVVLMPARSSLAFWANWRKCSSFFSFSFWASLRSICARVSTWMRAVRSAMYSDSDSLAKFSLMCTCCKPLPSAANRLSNGIVYPFAFFQLEMQGGIFQSACSCTVT